MDQQGKHALHAGPSGPIRLRFYHIGPSGIVSYPGNGEPDRADESNHNEAAGYGNNNPDPNEYNRDDPEDNSD